MKNIALIFAFQENSLFARKLVQGITEYRKEHELPWQTHLVEQTSFDPELFQQQNYDGIIGLRPPHCDFPSIPWVHISGQRVNPIPGHPSIEQDNEEIIRMAVDHLWRGGFRNLALFGYPRAPALHWQEERIAAFRKVCPEYGTSARLFFPGIRMNQQGTQQLFLKQALQSLPVPTGVVAVNDFRALDIIDAARKINLHIPEQIAVTGIDNDEMLCNISMPSLTSIEHFPEKKGRHAALMLDLLLQGRREIPEFPGFVQLIERDSTRALVHENKPLLTALEYIRQHAGTVLRTEDIAENAGVSRATLERIFRTELQSSVTREITAARISLAKQKLRQDAIPLKELAVQCGFRNVHYFTTVFTRNTGMSPGIYRKSTPRN